MLRCIFGLHRENAGIPALYKKFLTYSLFSRPLRYMEKAANYFFPKSIILYAQKNTETRDEVRGTRKENDRAGAQRVEIRKPWSFSSNFVPRASSLPSTRGIGSGSRACL
jgi:hypothetical protein